MVIVLSGRERRGHRESFERLFRLRYEVFVKARGWSLPAGNGLERDQYDDDDAVYVLDMDDDGSVEGHVRLTPTDKCSLLADYFPHLVENGESPRGPKIYEATRYIVLPKRKGRDSNRTAKARLLSGMLEWALEKRLAFIQTVIDTATLSSFVEMTPKTIPLGLSHPYGGGREVLGGGDCMAIRWPVTQQVLDDVLAYGLLRRGGMPVAIGAEAADALHSVH